MGVMLNVWDVKVVRKLSARWGELQGADTESTFRLAARSGDSFLDVGCGMGRFYGYLLEKKKGLFTYAGLDSSQAMIDAAKERFPKGIFFLHDVTEPFPPCQQDVVLCNEIFIHLLPDQQHKFICNLAAIGWRRLIITIQTRADLTVESPFCVQEVALKKRRRFYNVLQNVDVFCAELMNVLGSDVSISEAGRRDLVKSAERVELVVDRG